MAAHGAGRGLSLEPLTDGLSRPGNLAEQFQRLVDIGVRLNGRGEAGDLPKFIMEELVELTGAERAALALIDEAGGLSLTEAHLPLPVPAFMISDQELEPPAQTSEEFFAEIRPFLEESASKRAGLLRYLPEEASTLDQRSQMCAPLIVQGRLIGLVYADLEGCFGRFEPTDLDLLGVLANQAAVALDNAEWSRGLEERVEQRTAEIAQRNAELEIINAIQKGLASELDFQAIVDLVGDKLREVFNMPDLGIYWYDEKTNLLHYLYAYDHGERLSITPRPPLPGGNFETIQKTRQPIIYNTPSDHQEIAQASIEGTTVSLSWITVPIISSDQVLGVISLEDYERESAYGEAEVRLLTTIAGTLGAALENAHLFDETQRLLKETEQRNTELAIINSIQQGLAAELDFHAIVDLVGDKLPRSFSYDGPRYFLARGTQPA